MIATRHFYQASTLVPIVLTTAGGKLLSLVSATSSNAAVNAITGSASIFLLAGVFALLPYAVYLGAIWLFLRPVTERDYRRVVLWAPVAIALPLAVVSLNIVGWPAWSDWRAIVEGVLILSIPTLVFGYLYVAIILGALALARRMQWVQADEYSDTQTFIMGMRSTE